jgi:hypothetical protein
VATVRVDLFDDHGTLLRAVRTEAEAGGQRIERVLVMSFDEADERRPSDLRLFGSHPRAAGAEAWLGRPPSADLTLTSTAAEA